MKTVFVKSGVVVTSVSIHQPGIVAGCTVADASPVDVPDDSPVDIGYAYNSQTNTFTAPAARLPVLTPPQFRLLYTSPERIAIRANLASASPDPVISDFFTELNDPQLTQVDLNLASVQGAIQYSINFVAPLLTPKYTASDVTRRVAQMMTGVPQ